MPGIGVKDRRRTDQTYGDLDTSAGPRRRDQAAEAPENLLANAELARISRQLVTLRFAIDLDTAEHRGSELLQPQDFFRSRDGWPS